MRTITITLTTLLLTTLFAGSAAAETCMELKPGEGLGALKLGMTMAQLKATGLPIKQGHVEINYRVGPYEVWVKSDKVTAIEIKADEVACFQIKGAKVAFKGMSQGDLAQAIGGCGPIQMNTGGNVVTCGGGVELLQSMAGHALRVSDRATPPSPTCDRYVTPGAPKSPTASAEIKPGATVCAGTRVFTPKLVKGLKPADVTALGGPLRYNTRTTTNNRGGTVVECPFQGVRLIFAGPSQALHRVEAMPLKQ